MVKKLGVVVSVLLLVAAVCTAFTGQVAVMLDLNRFAYHKWAAYSLVALAVVHVALHWRLLRRQIENWSRLGGPGGKPRAPRPGLARRPAGRRALLAGLAGAAGGVVAGNLFPWEARAQVPDGEDLGEVYHRWSKPSYAGLIRKALTLPLQPPLYKFYPAPPIALPAVPAPEPGSLEAAIERRRSVRDYTDRRLTLDEVSRLLHYGAGITDRRDGTWPFRAYPSSGALFALELYMVAHNVAGLDPGVYHYNVKSHGLDLIRAGTFRSQAAAAAFQQEIAGSGALLLVVTSLFDRSRFKYADRAYRYDLIECGHLGENVYLAGTAMGLGVCGMGAFDDDAVNQLVGVDGKREAALYLLSVGPR